MRRPLSAAIALAFALPLLPATAQRSGAPSRQPKALDIVEKRYASLKAISQTISGTLSISALGDTAKATIDGKMLAARPNKFRLEMTINFFGEDRHVLIVSNGTRLIEYDADDQQYVEQPLGALGTDMDKLGTWFASRTGDVGIPLFLSAGRKTQQKATDHFGAVTKGTIDGHPVTIVSVKGAFAGASAGTLRIFVDTKDAVIRRFTIDTPLPKSKAGIAATMSLVLNYVDINSEPDLGSDAFDFTPPDDAKQVTLVRSVLARAMDLSR